MANRSRPSPQPKWRSSKVLVLLLLMRSHVHSHFNMKAAHIARIVWSITRQLLVWCVKISVCIVFILAASIVSAEYSRNNASELQRIKQRRITAYAKSNRHQPWAHDLNEIHTVALLNTSIYVTNVVGALVDCSNPVSVCNTIVSSVVQAWIENQSILAWLFVSVVCIYVLVSSCPIGDMYARVVSEIAVHRFHSSIDKHQIAHGGHCTN